MECLITYQKSNGDIFFRPRVSSGDLYVGKETSMGWKVLAIHYKYGDNYYVEHDYRKLRRKDKEPLKSQVARYMIKKLNKLTM